MKRFVGTFHWAQTSYFWRVYYLHTTRQVQGLYNKDFLVNELKHDENKCFHTITLHSTEYLSTYWHHTSYFMPRSMPQKTQVQKSYFSFPCHVICVAFMHFQRCITKSWLTIIAGLFCGKNNEMSLLLVLLFFFQIFVPKHPHNLYCTNFELALYSTTILHRY